ncbi:MAG: class I SAM-dependent methyltransferase [Planctomycetota bacterium]
MKTARHPKLETYRQEEVASSYDDRWGGAAGRRRQRRKRRALVRALLRLETAAGEPCRSVLDVPCGTGRFARLLAARVPLYRGADLSSAMLLQARSKHPRLPLLCADLGRLPFPDGSFGVAVCIRFLHLVRDPRLRIAFLRELRRVSRLGAILDYRHDRTLRVASRRVRHRMGWLSKPPANPSPEAIRAELAAAGFREDSWLPVHQAPWLSDKVLIVARCADRP